MKNEIQNEIYEINNDLYQNDWKYNSKELKTLKRKVRNLKKKLIALTPELTPGTEISLEDYIIRINNTNQFLRKRCANGNAKLKFFKEGYYTPEETSTLEEMLYNEYGVFAHFNKNYNPTDIKETELSRVQEKAKGSSIYDHMCARSESQMRLEFKVKLRYDQDPITVFKEFSKNTTLSQSDVRAFM